MSWISFLALLRASISRSRHTGYHQKRQHRSVRRLRPFRLAKEALESVESPTTLTILGQAFSGLAIAATTAQPSLDSLRFLGTKRRRRSWRGGRRPEQRHVHPFSFRGGQAPFSTAVNSGSTSLVSLATPSIGRNSVQSAQATTVGSSSRTVRS